MRQKAAERNPNEFSYGMLSSQSKQGRKLTDRQNPVLGQDVVKLLKTQDAGYVTTMLQKTKCARARLEQEVILSKGQGAELLGPLSGLERGRHKVFVNSREEQRMYNSADKVAFSPDSTKYLGILSTNEEEDDSNAKPPAYFPKDAPKSCRIAQRQELALKQEKLLRKHGRKEQDVRKLKLAALNAREKDLVQAKTELDLQRAKMGNSVGGTTKVGVKWKVRERKK